MTALKILGGFLVSLTAPIVTLFYRGGWYNTPDDPVSPRGLYEKAVLRINEWVLAKTGNRELANWVSDYWWLGFRNRAYGFDYAMKPAFFRNLTTYEGLNINLKWGKFLGFPMRTIWVEGYEERTIFFRLFHVIVGYRLRPIYDQVFDAKYLNAKLTYRPLNMDARPILSVRWGRYDD